MFLGSYNYHRLQRAVTWRYFNKIIRTEFSRTHQFVPSSVERTNIAVSNTDNALTYLVITTLLILCRSQWPRGLKRGAAAARILRWLVRIPPGAWMSIFCQVEGSATS